MRLLQQLKIRYSPRCLAVLLSANKGTSDEVASWAKPTEKGQNLESPPSLPPTEASSVSEEESDTKRKKEKSTASKRKKKSKKINRRASSKTLKGARREDLKQIIEKLQSIQEKMELRQVAMEKEHRFLQRYIDSMRRSKQKTEMRNRELERQLFEAMKEQEEKSNKRRASSFRNNKDLSKNIDAVMLAIENQILRDKMKRCKETLLETNERIGILSSADDSGANNQQRTQ